MLFLVEKKLQITFFSYKHWLQTIIFFQCIGIWCMLKMKGHTLLMIGFLFLTSFWLISPLNRYVNMFNLLWTYGLIIHGMSILFMHAPWLITKIWSPCYNCWRWKTSPKNIGVIILVGAWQRSCTLCYVGCYKNHIC